MPDQNTKASLLEAKTKNTTFDGSVASFVIGITARAAEQAVSELRTQGIRVGLFRPITLWPFPEEALRTATKTAKTVLVPKMNQGQLVLEVQRLLHGPQITPQILHQKYWRCWHEPNANNI